MKNTFQIEFSSFELLNAADASFFKKKIKEVLGILGVENRLLTVHLCDDAEIKALNLRFRNKNKATDVLSFEGASSDDDPMAEYLLGDIVISLETAKRQSDESGHPFRHELCVLFIHAILHLFGFDHERSPNDAVAQAEAELFLLSGIDIPVETALISRNFSYQLEPDV